MAVYTDTSRIDPKILKENFLALLGFPSAQGRGFVPVRVIAREYFYYMYDALQETQITAVIPVGAGINGVNDLGFTNPTRLASTFLAGKPFHVFSILNDNTQIYQLFYGIAPSPLRVYLEMPASTGQRNLAIDRWASNKASFGYTDGFDSPLFYPSVNTEMIIPPSMDFAFGYGNPTPTTIDPMILFYVNRLVVQVVTDPYLVLKMLNGTAPAAIKTIGGLSGFTYDVFGKYGIQPIALNARIQDIAAALNVPLTPQQPQASPQVTVQGQ